MGTRRREARRAARAARAERRKLALLAFGVGAVAAVLAVVIGLAGGSATIAWGIGLVSATALIMVPVYFWRLDVRFRAASLGWKLALLAAGLCIAVGGGVWYVVAPTDPAWWLGSAAALAVGFLVSIWDRDEPDDWGDAGPIAPP
jgi:hypothetical protein